MREIKFRGYNKRNGWVYGNLLEDDRPQEGSVYQIVNKTTESRFDVEEDSIGQYTGFKDRDGVEIYEGDIVKGCNENIYKVIYEEGKWRAERIIPSKIMSYELDLIIVFGVDVVGNIYEDKLKEEK